MAIILLIIFYFLTYIIILPIGAGSMMFSILDREDGFLEFNMWSYGTPTTLIKIKLSPLKKS